MVDRTFHLGTICVETYVAYQCTCGSEVLSFVYTKTWAYCQMVALISPTSVESFARMHSIQSPSYFKALFLGGCSLHHAEVEKIIPLGTHLASLTLTQTGRCLVSADTMRVAHKQYMYTHNWNEYHADVPLQKARGVATRLPFSMY
jgi:hypothetical protein